MNHRRKKSFHWIQCKPRRLQIDRRFYWANMRWARISCRVKKSIICAVVYKFFVSYQTSPRLHQAWFYTVQAWPKSLSKYRFLPYSDLARTYPILHILDYSTCQLRIQALTSRATWRVFTWKSDERRKSWLSLMLFYWTHTLFVLLWRTTNQLHIKHQYS